MVERADAARNRRAILLAAERLLAERGVEHVSLDEVAAAAGVGKGTVFRRFGNRTGLMRALVEQRTMAMIEALSDGPPPLGPGAPPLERLIAFLDAVTELATANVALIAAYEHALTNEEHAERSRQSSPLYQAWHRHVAGLIVQARPDLDGELLAHILLGSLHSDLVRHLLARGESERLNRTLRYLASTLLAAPATRTGSA
ncbi:TetR/AcrR family transcriptional regulator [Rugosimonospora acidiphila]|uniref:TetR/AcrR family transcriptional regulator n=1 Tax=Rugosimonospora acidiphila TaxID=556531 RepID=A0ABP9SIX5_9ACTN